MINLYYTLASGSNPSSITIIPDSQINSTEAPLAYSNVTLEITASAYDTSGSTFDSTVGNLRAYIKSGSTILASFPIEDTNIYYSYKGSTNFDSTVTIIYPQPSYNSSSFNIEWSFTPNSVLTSSLDTFTLYSGSFSIASASIYQTQSYYYGLTTLQAGKPYNIIISGSGIFYTSSLLIINNATKTIVTYITSSNNYISTSFSSSISNNHSITATTTTLPYIQLAYSGSPVSPTSSLDAWNTYLNVTASSIVNSGSNVYLIGGTLDMLPSFSLDGTKSKDFTNFYSYGLYSLTSCSIIDGILLNIPNISFLPYLQYLDCSGNKISSSLPDFSNNPGLIYFDCSSNNITGSIPSFTGSGYPFYFNCNNNKLSGSIPNLSTAYNLQYFDCSYNLMTGSILSSSLNNCYNLQYFYCNNNSLSGSIPNLSNCYSLKEFYCSSNRISGSIPSLNNNNNLQYFSCDYNKLSGSIPSLSNNPSMSIFTCTNNTLSGSIGSLSGSGVTNFDCSYNNLIEYISCSANLSSQIQYFNASYNALPQSSIDGILYDIRYSTQVSGGTLYLQGGTNAAPSVTGNDYKTYLVSTLGWTVNTN
jgi:hypothetical protein